MSDEIDTSEAGSAMRAPIEYRNAAVSEVNFDKRTVTLIAIPYGETAVVRYRSELMEEEHQRGAYDNLETVRPGRIKANRDHDINRPVGKVMKWHPKSSEGLLAEVRISQTTSGDETLALADDEVLGASLGFFIRPPGGQQIERRSGGQLPRRVVTNAGVHHLAFTADPAYEGASVLSVRNGENIVSAAELPQIHTPVLDEWTAYLSARRAGIAS
jgi:phage head maturation protease